MCFSATASFTTAVALIPVGLAALTRARGRQESAGWLPLACLPLLFALQQGLEGLVWLGLDQGAALAALRPAALAYLAMAFALWPIWIPWSALRLCPSDHPCHRLVGQAAGAAALAAAVA